MIADYLLRREARAARRRGDQAAAAGRWPEAAQAYRRYLAIRPDDAALWVQLGHALSEAGDFDGADLAYRTAQQSRPDDADLLLCWGHSRKRAGDRDGARDLYARSVAIDGNADADANLAEFTPPAPEPEPAPSEPPPPFARAARFEVVKPFEMHGGEVALLAAYSRSGALLPHVPAYLRALREEGIGILLVANVDHPLDIPADVLDLIDGALVRENAGFHFAAWSHAMWLHPELYGASILYLLNDSMAGPAGGGRFARLIARVRASSADLVGLTESQEHRWHVQSYFWALKPGLLGAFDLHLFFRRIRLLTDRAQAIRDYELSFAFDVEQWGRTVERLFPSAIARDPTAFGWRALLRDGFPFFRLALLRGRVAGADDEGWQPLMRDAGFDLDLVEAAVRAADEEAPHDRADLLSAHPPARDHGKRRPLRIALYGPLAHDGERGAAARALADTLRGHRLNLFPVRTFHEEQPLAPAVEVIDFVQPPDIALVQLDPEDWPLLTDAQRAAIDAAPKRIAIWSAAARAAPASLAVDRIWAPDAGSAAALADESDTPVDCIADAAAMEASLRRTMARDRPPPPEPPLTPSLAAGVPFEEADLGEAIRAVPLAADGSVESLPDAVGDGWIALAPRGTLITPHFARVLSEHAARRPDAAIFYADDIAVEADEPIDQLRLKPEFDPALLAAQDYVGAPLIVRASVLARLGLDRACGTAAVADLLFRADAAGLSIARIPEVLLAHPGRRVRATADDYRRMLTTQPSLASYEIRPGRVAECFAPLRRFTSTEVPAVTLIVPTRRTPLPNGGGAYVEQLLAGIAAVDWPMERLTVLVGDDIAGEPGWGRATWPFALRRIETVRGADEPFNYAAKMNRLWRLAETEQIVFLNDDVRPLAPDWLAALQTFATDPTIGGVGARLLFEDGGLQHAGVAPHGLGVGHVWVNRRRVRGTYQDWALVQRQWSMVTGAVFATRRSAMERVGGFDEFFSVEFNDVDLCLRLRMLGYRIVCNPEAELVHVEKASRGEAPPAGDQIARFLARWSAFLVEDPAWHPALRRDRVDMTPAWDEGAWYM